MRFLILAPLLLLVLLTGCTTDSHQDLRDFIAENKRRPPGKIPEAPKFEPYEAFTYDAYRMRSPFEKPVTAEVQQRIIASSGNVKPDFNRQKERLEQYDLNSLTMVGTLRKDGVLWALVGDPDGSIERIRQGNYIGRNHGKVTALAENKLELLEIVASGEGWLERPNVLELKVVEEK